MTFDEYEAIMLASIKDESKLTRLPPTMQLQLKNATILPTSQLRTLIRHFAAELSEQEQKEHLRIREKLRSRSKNETIRQLPHGEEALFKDRSRYNREHGGGQGNYDKH